MSMHFRDLADQAAAKGTITPEEILALRQAGWSDGAIQPDEADAIFAINDHMGEQTVEWTDFFVEAIGEFVINGSEPRGYVGEAKADWLIERIDHDGCLRSMTELELLAKVLDRATNAPDRLKTYALAQIEQAVMTGAGPTRGGGSLEPGCIGETEAHLLRRFLFAQAGDRPAAVSRSEAELLFRLKDAALGKDNAPQWKRLFVQGVGNYLRGFSGYEPLSSQRAAELESFMNDKATSIAGFFARMGRSTMRGDAPKMFGRKGVERDITAEVAQADQVTGDENLWLRGHIDADGQLDEYEQALLDFLAEE